MLPQQTSDAPHLAGDVHPQSKALEFVDELVAAWVVDEPPDALVEAEPELEEPWLAEASPCSPVGVVVELELQAPRTKRAAKDGSSQKEVRMAG
jgi:hypothetical protein